MRELEARQVTASERKTAEEHWKVALATGKKWRCRCAACRKQRAWNKAADARCVRGVDYV